MGPVHCAPVPSGEVGPNLFHRQQSGTEFFPSPFGWFGERLLGSDVQLCGGGRVCVPKITENSRRFIQGGRVGPRGRQSSACLGLNPNPACVELPQTSVCVHQQSGSLGLKS